MTKPEIVGASLIVLGVLYGGWAVMSIMNERDKAVEANAALLRSNLALILETEKNRAALAEREAEIKKLNAEADLVAAALQKEYKNDPKAKAWADCAMPDAIACLLR
jgi:hypothetical protein